MNEHDKQVLMRIQRHTELILQYTEGCNNKSEFLKDSMRVDACVFNLMQIGELSNQQLSDEAKDQINNIPWKEIYGLRNRIVHGYDGINFSIIWTTLKEDIPSLNKELLTAINDISKTNNTPRRSLEEIFQKAHEKYLKNQNSQSKKNDIRESEHDKNDKRSR